MPIPRSDRVETVGQGDDACPADAMPRDGCEFVGDVGRGLTKTRLRPFSSALGSGRPKGRPGLYRTSVTAEEIGRRERIRTSGPYVPNVVLYQAELLSEPVAGGLFLASGGALITMPPPGRNRAERLWRQGLFSRLPWPGLAVIRSPAAGQVVWPPAGGPHRTTRWGVAKW
jgi:hypothetical protein